MLLGNKSFFTLLDMKHKITHPKTNINNISNDKSNFS